MAGGTPIMERNMEYGQWNSHCGTEHGTHKADGTLIVEHNMEHTRRTEPTLCNGTRNTVGGTLIVERNIEHGGWNSHFGRKHGTRRVELSLWKGT